MIHAFPSEHTNPPCSAEEKRLTKEQVEQTTSMKMEQDWDGLYPVAATED
jgi:hypothetical protein